MLWRRQRKHRGASEQIPRAIARADLRAVALGYLIGTGSAAAVIAEVARTTA